MDSRLAKSIIEVIRQEKNRRASLLKGENPDFADDQWLFRDLPFIAELCLMLLVALRHQVERELIGFAACAADGGNEISPQQYHKRVDELRRGGQWDWKNIEPRLKLKSCIGEEQIEALRLLANCYKHDTSKEPDEKLLKLLGLQTGVRYAQLPESEGLREGLAVFTGLDKDADYCEIAETFTDIVDCFLTDVRKKNKLSRVKWGAASLRPEDFAR
jgi:hypothetical protein